MSDALQQRVTLYLVYAVRETVSGSDRVASKVSRFFKRVFRYNPFFNILSLKARVSGIQRKHFVRRER